MLVLAELTVYPLDKGESVGDYVARCLDVVDSSGLDYRCHAMGTEVEGELDRGFEVARRCFDALAVDCHRIECELRLDYRRDRAGGLEAKVASVERRLGRALHK